MIPFKGEERYPDLKPGYELYSKRAYRTPEKNRLSEAEFSRIVKAYCKLLSERLVNEGFIELPYDIGAVAAVKIRRTPKFDPIRKSWRTADSIDWKETKKAGRIVRKDEQETIGFAFVPKHAKGRDIFRCFGIRSNRMLYDKVKERYDSGELRLTNIETFGI